MSPLEPSSLEDVLRSALSGRAATLAPPVDPFAGVERRARGMHRRRAGAAVAGTALAVLAVVAAVPLLSAGPSGPAPGRVATSTAPTASPGRYAFDPDSPWPYRGDTTVRDAHLAVWQRDWAAREAGATLVPLYGQVDEPSGHPELVFVSRLPGDDALTVGVATTDATGSRFVVGPGGEADAAVFVVRLHGDEGDRWVAVASPRTTRFEYAPDGSAFHDAAPLAPGVATGPVEQPRGAFDQLLVVGPDGLLLAQTGVADERATEPVAQTLGPVDLLGWPSRGTVDPDLLLAARRAYADSRHVADVGRVQEQVLVGGAPVDGGPGYLLGQFWLTGDRQADTFGVVGGVDDLEVQTRPRAGAATAALALHLTAPGGSRGGTLVVVPRPGTGQVLYSPDAGAAFAAAGSDDPALDGVVVLGRPDSAERAGTDRVRLLDGDGRTTATLDVFRLLCGSTSCG
ncbi:MAG: hypothetical protein JWN17_669 [Frankiales bacterium]|nr:hypothetical protein [Frankiales bacterium]